MPFQFHNRYETIAFITGLTPFILGNIDKGLGITLMLFGFYNTYLSIKLKHKELKK